MEYWTQHPDLRPSVLSQYVRTVLEDRPIEEHILDRWFPASFNPNLEYEISLGSLRSYTEAMGFRAYDAEPGPAQRYGYETLTGKLPPLGSWLPLTEGEVLQLQRNTVPNWVRDEIYNDVDALVRALRNRMELARAECVLSGTVTLTGNISTLSADWGRDAARTVTVGTTWAAGAGDPFADERAVFRAMRDNNREPAVVLMPSEVIDELETHTDYLAAYQGITGAASAPTLITLEQINLTRRQYDLPPAVRYDAKIAPAGGAAAKVIGVDTIVYLPSGPVGETQYGRPVSASEPEINITADVGGPVVFVSKKKAIPVSYATNLDGIALPILGDADSTAAMQVIL